MLSVFAFLKSDMEINEEHLGNLLYYYKVFIYPRPDIVQLPSHVHLCISSKKLIDAKHVLNE